MKLSRAFARALVTFAVTQGPLAQSDSSARVALPLSAGVLAYRGVISNPAVGAILMSISAIVVAINAQLLRRTPL